MDKISKENVIMVQINIISGFLGSGKTTLIKKLLAEVFTNEKIAIIENEFGEIGIDSGFLKESGVEIKELDSGCICCSLVGDFETSLKEVVDTYKPERVIIEPSGVGKLSDVSKAVEAVKNSIDGVLHRRITVVDATKCKMYFKNFGEFFIDQVASADIIILSRVDKASEQKVQDTLALLQQLNKTATVVTTPISTLSGEVLRQAMEQQADMNESLLQEVQHHHEHGKHCGCGHHHDKHEHHHEHGEHCGCGCHHEHHHADEVFQSVGIQTTSSYSREEIQTALEALTNQEEYGIILRAKGMVQGNDGTWIYFDYVPEGIELRSGQAQVTGKICVIGAQIDKSKITALFNK